jgi:hypothetical protein
MADGNYTIEARSFSIGPFSHDFYVLRDPAGNVMAELHGFATIRGSNPPKTISIGTDPRVNPILS